MATRPSASRRCRGRCPGREEHAGSAGRRAGVAPEIAKPEQGPQLREDLAHGGPVRDGCWSRRAVTQHSNASARPTVMMIQKIVRQP